MEIAKEAAALRACEMVEDGMRIGLGTGSTARFVLRRLGQRVREERLSVVGVPTSDETARIARDEGIALTTLEEAGRLDLTIDGADEADAQLSLIKGGGGALLREKIVATASERMVAVADASKRVEALGAFPLPVEIVAFGWTVTRDLIVEVLRGADVLGYDIRLREVVGGPLVTDEGHRILDLHLRRIGNPRDLAMRLNMVPGVVETGLFCDICDVLVLGHGDGRVEVTDVLDRKTNEAPAEPDVDNVFADF
ncbi:ribose-5-phosphate isomerase RpiA [Rhodobacteraceae bacterium MCCB 386]|nr:ribose-5-phosphate isomerase RpiA [Roseitranquillus sediminis]